MYSVELLGNIHFRRVTLINGVKDFLRLHQLACQCKYTTMAAMFDHDIMMWFVLRSYELMVKAIHGT